MLISYLKLAIRTLLKNRTYTLINFFGLLIGVTSSLLIAVYILHEVNYDRTGSRSADTYRITSYDKFDGAETFSAHTPALMSAEMKLDFPEVETATRIYKPDPLPVAINGNYFQEQEALYADSNFLKVFDYKLSEGDDAAMARVNTVFLTAAAARKYFGNADPLNRSLSIGRDLQSFKVAGIIPESRANSHFHFAILLSMSSYRPTHQPNWGWNDSYTYVILRKDASVHSLEAKMPALVKKNVGSLLQQIQGISFDEFTGKGNAWGYSFQPISSIHLHSHLAGEYESNSDAASLYILGVIAVLIILVANINYINIATSHASNRAKEVGIRKVMGSSRKLLIIQFLSESLLFSIFSAITGFLLALFLIGPFGRLAGESGISLSTLPMGLIFCVLGVVLFFGILASLYPAFYLSGFNPIEVLKGKIRMGMQSSTLRNSIVVIQFTFSTTLIVSTIIIFNQLQYLRNKDMGFTKENLMILPNAEGLVQNKQFFKNDLVGKDGIESIGFSTAIPSNDRQENTVIRKDGSDKDFPVSWFSADQDFVPAMGIKISDGRNFSKQFGSEDNSILINEAAAMALGLKEPIGKTVHFSGTSNSLRIIGVFKNFNFESVNLRVKPLLVRYADSGTFAAVRMRPQDVTAGTAAVKREWMKLNPRGSFEYFFLDQFLNQKFRNDERVQRFFILFTALSIFVSCLGLFGMVAFATEQRAKEIAIRKLLGASLSNVLSLLLVNFFKLIALAFVISIPISWFFMKNWLDNFAFRIRIGAGVYLLGAITVVIIAACTICFQVLKAALANPVGQINKAS